MFKSLVTWCFGHSSSAESRVRSVLRYLVTDALYDKNGLETVLCETFGQNILFDYINNTVSGTQVALTATSAGNTRSIFTNYNGNSLTASDNSILKRRSSSSMLTQIRLYFDSTQQH